MQVHVETDTRTHTQPTLSDRVVNTAVQSEADTRLAVTHSGPGPALSLLGGGRGGANSGGKLGKGIPSGRPARVAESQRSLSRQLSPPPPPPPGKKRACNPSLPPGRMRPGRERGAAGFPDRPHLRARAACLLADCSVKPCLRGLVFGQHVRLPASVWPPNPRPAGLEWCVEGLLGPQARRELSGCD